ncbi:MAG: hypothetical protein KF832_25320 [Caldilineaceae bacterium]|nr:hypothetical protein [Caldilineaceae bacterium]
MFTLPISTTITAIQQDNYRTKTFTLDLALDAIPGQFIMAWLPRFDEKPFSLVNANPATLMITAVGPFSRLMHEKKPGDKVWLRGPLGQGYHVPPQQRRLALVGGGYGVAPLYWLARTQQEQTTSIDVIMGARTAADLLYGERFQQLGAGVTLHQATEDGSAGQRGRVTDLLKPLLAAQAVDGIYACGPHGMLSALEALGQTHALPTQLSWESYMRCGIGICGACEHEGKVLCLDGPVLASS